MTTTLDALENKSHEANFVFTLNSHPVTIKTKATCTCNKCMHIWTTAVGNLIRKDGRSSGCPNCAKNKRSAKLVEDGKKAFIAILESENYSILTDYTGIAAKVNLKCSNGHIFTVSPTNFKGGQRCPIRSNTFQHVSETKAIAEYIKDTSWEIVDYKDNLYNFRCSTCGAKKTIKWDSLLAYRKQDVDHRHCSCTIGTIKLTEYFKDLSDYELLSNYTRHKDIITVKHVTCGTVWHPTPSNFL